MRDNKDIFIRILDLDSSIFSRLVEQLLSALIRIEMLEREPSFLTQTDYDVMNTTRTVEQHPEIKLQIEYLVLFQYLYKEININWEHLKDSLIHTLPALLH